MRYDPLKHHRRSIRLQGYDYARAGAYFITIVTQHRLCLFGDILDGHMRPNAAGQMIEKWWLELARKFPLVTTDAYAVMPNHFHGIILIADNPPPANGNTVGADLRVCPEQPANTHTVGADLRVGPDPCVGPDLRVGPMGAHTGAPLPRLVQWFKTMTTNDYIRAVKAHGWPPFPGKLWQRNYYEHIVRDDATLARLRGYIDDNPRQWELDEENPARAAARP